MTGWRDDEMTTKVPVAIKPDHDGFTGRECPNDGCLGYFKIEFGTGLQGDNLPCHCPYCGHPASHDHFWTREQNEHAKSVVLGKVWEDVQRETQDMFRQAFRNIKNVSFKPGRIERLPIHRYAEKQLETEVICDNCSLRYEVYGAFAYCPDCAQRNSQQILHKSLEVTEKLLSLASDQNADLRNRLVENGLEDCISAFDGFGRELCQLHCGKAKDPEKARKMSFQSIAGARKNLKEQFGVEISHGLSSSELSIVVGCFQKRHLFEHKMGVVDDKYIRESGDTTATVGRRISVDPDEILQLIKLLKKMASEIVAGIEAS